MIRSPLALRWDRAKSIPDSDVRVHRVEHMGGYTVAFGWVRSQSEKKFEVEEPTGYSQIAMFAAYGKQVGCQCIQCPDFNNPELQGLGEPLLRGLRECKHSLKFAEVAQRQVVELL